jgi:hypothetical protein
MQRMQHLLALQVMDSLVEAGLEASTFTYNILMSVHLRFTCFTRFTRFTLLC